eukprot:SAG31_NODE_13717_length_851_cov_1.857713_2_plen_81_part_00
MSCCSRPPAAPKSAGLTGALAEAFNFFDACENGKGWDACAAFCAADTGKVDCQLTDANPMQCPATNLKECECIQPVSVHY